MELRCAWVTKDPEYIEYHDKQWGRPVRDPRELFAKLCLDGQQAVSIHRNSIDTGKMRRSSLDPTFLLA